MWQVWTEAPSVPSALVSMLLRLPNLRFAIVTLGEDGCIMLERSVDGEYSIAQFLPFEWEDIYARTVIGSETWNGQACSTSKLNMQVFISLLLAESPELEEIDVDSLLEQLKQRKDDNIAVPTCVSSVITSTWETLLLLLSSKYKLHHSIYVVLWKK